MRETRARRLLLLAAAALMLPGSLPGATGAVSGNDSPGGRHDPDELVLAHDGRSEYRVVIAGAADPQISAVAADFVRIFRDMTGVDIPLVTDAEPMGDHAILIGPSAHLDELAMHVDWDGLGPEGYIIRTHGPSPLQPGGPHLALVGGPLGGTRNAVYTFVDEHLGCRFYSPELTVIPKRPDLRVGILHIERTPVFEARNVNIGQAADPVWASRLRLNYFRRQVFGWRPDPDGLTFSFDRWHGYTGNALLADSFFYAGNPIHKKRRPNELHTFAPDMLVPSSLAEQHPDYFALRTGLHDDKRHPANGVCPTSPGVFEVVVANAKDWIRRAPYARIVSISMADVYYACGCARCAKAGEEWTYTQPVTPQGKATRPTRNRWLPGAVRLTGVLLDFVNRAADAIHEEFPDVLVHTFAYNWTTFPPANWTPAQGLVIDFAPLQICRYHSLAQCAHNEEVYGYWTKLRLWTQKSPHVWIWDYAYGNSEAPAPILRHRRLFYRELAAAGVAGAMVHMCGATDQWLGELRGYLYAKLMWNPDFDVTAAIAEYCTHAYGVAGQVMCRYILETQHPANYGYEPPPQYAAVPGFHARGSYVREDALGRWDKLLAAAETEVREDPASLARVRLQHDIHRRFTARQQKAGTTE